MLHRYVIIFMILSGIFASVHLVAVRASLYWYYWWFDIMMHFWGGILIGLGVYAFCTFSYVRVLPTLGLMVVVLTIITGTWEIFEWLVGAYDPATHVFDTVKDIVVGFSGGLLAHVVLKKYTIRS